MQFLYSHWLKLPVSTRTIIATALSIAKTSPTHVQDNVVVNDGYKIQDVENALNLDALQKYLNSDETDFNILWDLLIAKTEGREVEQAIEDNPNATVIEPPKQKRKYTKRAK